MFTLSSQCGVLSAVNRPVLNNCPVSGFSMPVFTIVYIQKDTHFSSAVVRHKAVVYLGSLSASEGKGR